MKDCGCCTTPLSASDIRVENRAGLSAITYRVGTFATFRKAITDKLSRVSALAGLTSRTGDDYSITLIELWSAVADVLTFYQERIANEAYLGTATLRDSVLRLVRLIDYQLRPGAAATSRLAFTLEADARARIPAGTRVQSVPTQSEKPQKFETLVPLEADARLNRLRVYPRPVEHSPLAQGSVTSIVAPDPDAMASASSLAPGDRVMLYAPGAIEVLTVREVRPHDDLLVVTWSAPIDGTAFAAAADGDETAVRAYKAGRSFNLFGYDAPEKVVVAEMKAPPDKTTSYLDQAATDFDLHPVGTPTTQIWLDARYPGLKAGATVLVVSANGTSVKANPFTVKAAVERHVSRTAKPTTADPVTSQSGKVTQLEFETNVLTATTDVRGVVVYELLGEPLRFWCNDYPVSVPTDEVFLPGRRAGWSSVEVGRILEKGRLKAGVVIDTSDLPAGREVVLTDASGATASASIAGASIEGDSVRLAVDGTSTLLTDLGLDAAHVTPITVIASPPLGDKIPLGSVRELRITIGNLPAQTIALASNLTSPASPVDIAMALDASIRAALDAPTFKGAMAWVPDEVTGDPTASGAIAVVAGVAGDRITFGPSPNDQSTVALLGLDPTRARYFEGLLSGPLAGSGMTTGMILVWVGTRGPFQRPIVFAVPQPWGSSPGYASDLARNYLEPDFKLPVVGTRDERLIVLPPLPAHEMRAYIRVALRSAAPAVFDTRSAVLLGNVVSASHGETVHDEILGDGDASSAFQQFALKKKPLTYVPSAVPGGVSSSLHVRVGGAEWSEVPSLYGRRDDEQVYISRTADDGTTTIEFGDGLTGARPTTGRHNIVATYRHGTGLAGRVGARTLTTLLDRPTGVKGAVNPIAADGGADPESLARARTAAPGTVRTFGRAVSLGDFEDTALLAGEVAKVDAKLVWDGDTRAVHLTVAAQGGAIFSSDGIERLKATLASERDPNRRLLMANYVRIPIRLDAQIIVDDRHLASDVLAAARAALLDALSFDRREFAQPVYLSDIERILQNVEGVVAVDVNTLDLKSKDPGVRKAHGVDDTIVGPQPRLLMLPARPSGGLGEPLPAELAWIEVPGQDVTLSTTGGLPS